MHAVDALVEKILSHSQVPSGKLRREIARELRAHIEDSVLAAQQLGRADEEIERMVLTNFGDPEAIGRTFASVYRYDRAALELLVFGLTAMAAASITAIATLTAQTGLAAALGIPLFDKFWFKHTRIEAADILVTAVAYAGVFMLEKLFSRAAAVKALALISLVFGAIWAVSISAGGSAPFLIFGAANTIVLRSCQAALKTPARLVAVPVCFGVAGALLWRQSPVYPFASWFAMGLGYQLMTSLTARVGSGLSGKLQNL